MDRARIAGLIDLAHGRGLEIGALDRPLLSRDEARVEYVDRAPREALQAFYRADPAVDVDAIVEVHHVWSEQSLFEAVGGRRDYDYLVASHVIEHVPDLLGWLQEAAAVLCDGALGVFVTPDKRFTFDMRRRTSSGAELVDAYVRRLRRPDTRQLFDGFYEFRDPQTGADRGGALASEASTTQRARELLEQCAHWRASGDYIDAHCWVFTPRSMVELLDLASRLDLLAFEVASLEPTEPGSIEFLLALRRLPDALDADGRRAAFVASVERLDLPAEDEALDADASQHVARAEAATARLAAIQASTSWRITAPLRAAVTWGRRLRGRGPW